MFIQTEPTPNPATLKFLPGRPVLASGTLDLRDKDSAAQSPLAERLFEIDGVTGVFYGSDFISVTKTDGEWQQLKPAILGAIMEHFMSGEPLVRSADGAVAEGEEEFFETNGFRNRRHHQGADRDAGPAGGCQRRRRYHVSRLQGWYRLSQHEGRVFGLPVVDRDAAPRHPESPAPLSSRRGRGSAGLSKQGLSLGHSARAGLRSAKLAMGRSPDACRSRRR